MPEPEVSIAWSFRPEAIRRGFRGVCHLMDDKLAWAVMGGAAQGGVRQVPWRRPACGGSAPVRRAVKALFPAGRAG